MRSPLGIAVALLLLSWAVPAQNAPARGTWSTAWTHSPQEVDDWAAQTLADPESDVGWNRSCGEPWGPGRASYCVVRELPVDRIGSPIAIDGGDNGGMTVIGWDRNEVRALYRVVARARTKERARELAEAVRIERSRGKFLPNGPTTSDREYWATDVRMWVPRSSDLSLRVLNGPLAIEDVHGTMAVEAITGPVSLVNLGGAVEARVRTGPLYVALSGTRWDGAGIDAVAESGPVTIVLPRDYSARLETGTISGTSNIRYPLQTRSTRGGRIVTALGSGGPPVRVVTDSGPFTMVGR
ncbi:MAG TPA: hypothetical protein VJY35_03770 [Candidatus Eisenbacteria bacterium]|nr:hypothetical protein [Candidatus Eisenbacteria bacterium]